MKLRFLRLPTILVVALLSALAVAVAVAVADDNPQPIDFTHNVAVAPAPVTSAVFGQGNGTPGVAFCTTTASDSANVNTDCDPNQPHNETSIAVNPQNASNIIGGANDYQLGVNPGGHVSETVLSRAHVSFDGGHTWSEYPLYSNQAYQATGDPAVAFDASGHAYYATLGFRFVGPGNAQNADVLVANSGDGGKNWAVSRVAQGSGVETSVGDFLDKEYITAWGNGNALVTWDDFRQAQKGAVTDVRIYTSVTHDYGATWSAPTVVSGSLDQAFAPVPTYADGNVYIAFLDTLYLDPSTSDYGRDEYYVVKVSAQTGGASSLPVPVAKTIDGAYDYPIFGGRTVYQDSLFRTWAAGNITVDPTRPSHLAVVWSDMRNSPSFFPTIVTDPYSVATNSDVVVSESFDGGGTWSTPHAIALSGDQFMPWGAFDAAGKLRIGYFDRHYDTANHLYGYSLSTETAAASTATVPTNSFDRTPVPVTTTLSDPTQNDRWFATTANDAFPHATQFMGDYSNIAVIPGTTGVVAYWTDMRDPATFAGVTRSGENAYFASIGG